MSAVNELVITPEFVTNIIAVDLAEETTFTTADKAKLNGIEAGAQVNTVTRVAGKTGAVDLNAGDIAYDASETYASGKIGAALKSAEEKLDALDAGDIGYDGSATYDTGTVGKELTELNRQINHFDDNLPGTVQTVNFGADGKPSSVVHTKNGTTVRTDAYTWGDGTVTETRTTADGSYITMVTDLSTLVTTISEIQEAS